MPARQSHDHYNLLAKGKLKARELGNRTLISVERLQAYFASLPPIDRRSIETRERRHPKLILQSGPGLRASQRKISRRIVELLALAIISVMDARAS
jgi:hypothetical protein